MTKPEIIALAKQTATKYALPPDVVMGIIEQESSFDTWAIRYEPEFQIRYVKALDLDPTTSVARSISWGLMQVMGQSVREIGYVGPLPQLCDPATGIEWGCRLFMTKMAHAAGNVEAALSLWNGGGNPNYALDVTQKANYYRNSGLA